MKTYNFFNQYLELRWKILDALESNKTFYTPAKENLLEKEMVLTGKMIGLFQKLIGKRIYIAYWETKDGFIGHRKATVLKVDQRVKGAGLITSILFDDKDEKLRVLLPYILAIKIPNKESKK